MLHDFKLFSVIGWSRMSYYSYYAALYISTHNNRICNYIIHNYAALYFGVPSFLVTITLQYDIAIAVLTNSNNVCISFTVLCNNIADHQTAHCVMTNYYVLLRVTRNWTH